jgi:F0F1-type ATP synthase alpha subunit
MRLVGGAYKIELAQYFELEAFSQFASDIGGYSQRLLARGERLVALLHQFPANPLSASQQVRALSLARQPFFLLRSGQELKALAVLLLTLPEWLSVVVAAKSICLSSLP